MASIKKTENGTYRVSWREPTGRQRSKFFELMREAKAHHRDPRRRQPFAFTTRATATRITV